MGMFSESDYVTGRTVHDTGNYRLKFVGVSDVSYDVQDTVTGSNKKLNQLSWKFTLLSSDAGTAEIGELFEIVTGKAYTPVASRKDGKDSKLTRLLDGLTSRQKTGLTREEYLAFEPSVYHGLVYDVMLLRDEYKGTAYNSIVKIVRMTNKAEVQATIDDPFDEFEEA